MSRGIDATIVFLACHVEVNGLAILMDAASTNRFLSGTRREQLMLILGLAKPLLFAVYADFAAPPNVQERLIP